MNTEQWGAAWLVIGNVWAASGHALAGLFWIIGGGLLFFMNRLKNDHA